MRCVKASLLSQFVLTCFCCINAYRHSHNQNTLRLRGKEKSYRKMSGWPNKEEAGQNINHLWTKATTNGVCLDAEQKSWLISSQIGSGMHTFLKERRPESIWNWLPFHHRPHTLHILRASTNSETRINKMGMFVDCNGKLEKLEKPSTCTGRTWKPLTETSIRAMS